MQLETTLITPFLGFMKAEEDAEFGKLYSATVIDVKDATVHLQLNADLTARVTFAGSSAVKAGAVIKFQESGQVRHVDLPKEAPTRAPQTSSRRSPRKEVVAHPGMQRPDR